ncbi:MAG: hypothetical protein EAZ53_08950 [Bacteroidetes bacterium]|nr:MAG: hypothetical protein EAZ53_08950 [Bacteroidota bacterium]
MENESKSIITIATGKDIYIQMACNLAMSFLLWNVNNNISFYLVTDNSESVPECLKNKINIILINSVDYPTGFSIKLYLDKFIQTDKNLFIDCDCLIYGNLSYVFDLFEGKTMSAIGEEWNKGEFFCSVEKMIKVMNIPHMPVFVGALYYVQKSNITSQIFEFARKTQKKYDELGFVRLRGKENEEPLLSVAMAKFNQTVIKDNFQIKADMMSFTEIQSNIINGKAHLSNNNGKYPTWQKCDESFPLIVHFNSSFTEGFQYKTEIFRLKLYRKINLKLITNVLAGVFLYFPGKSKQILKSKFRPFYHKLLGIRTLQNTNR